MYSLRKCSRSAARQAPPNLTRGEAVPQAGVVLFAERGLVHVTAQHLQQIMHETRLHPTRTEAVVHPPAIPARLDKANGAEVPQVPRDLVLGNAERIDEFADAKLLSAQQPQ
jgi:hypothetical protein